MMTDSPSMSAQARGFTMQFAVDADDGTGQGGQENTSDDLEIPGRYAGVVHLMIPSLTRGPIGHR